MTLYPPEELYLAGWKDLVSVVPPGAHIAPRSTITPTQIGKVPGKRLQSGFWAGYDWRTAPQPTQEDVRQWCTQQANIGLRADYFPAVDIDCTSETLANHIERIVIDVLGPAPRRVGKAPKRLLMYRTETPFTRARLWMENDREKHLVEVLGAGQQYLIYGTHPATLRPFQWTTPPTTPDNLTAITSKQIDDVFRRIMDDLSIITDWEFYREGDGKEATERASVPQTQFHAPSIDDLRAVVQAIPNTDDRFPDRTSYLTIGYAIRAASGSATDEGLAIFSEWADRWDGNDRFPQGNDPDTVISDWRRMREPFAVGWNYLLETAQSFGYNSAAHDFTVLEETSDAKTELTSAVIYSDQWLAQKIIEKRRGGNPISCCTGKISRLEWIAVATGCH